MFAPAYLLTPPAWFYPRILVGAGSFLTQRFAAEHGITHVINCADDSQTPEWFSDGFPHRYVCLDAIDSVYVNILDWYPKFEASLQHFLREGTGTVYVHCQAGMNRSGCLALAYVCRHYNLPLESVVTAARSQRPVLFQNPVFMNQVKEFINNGRLPRSENTRLDVDRIDDRDSGLFTPGHHQGPSGDQHDAGQSSSGTGHAVPEDLGAVRPE
jgi:hypothetical protein